MTTNHLLCRAGNLTTGAPSSDDGSADEGVTIVESGMVANGSTQSSPTIKKEKP